MVPRKPQGSSVTSSSGGGRAPASSPLALSRLKAKSRRASGATIEQQTREEYHELIAESIRVGDAHFKGLKKMLRELMSKEVPSSLDEDKVQNFSYGEAIMNAKHAYENFNRLDHDNRVIRLPKYKRLLIKYAKIATHDANTALMNEFSEYAATLAQLSEFCSSAALGNFVREEVSTASSSSKSAPSADAAQPNETEKKRIRGCT